MKRRLIEGVLVFAVAFMLISCGKAEENQTQDETTTESETDSVETILFSDGSDDSKTNNTASSDSESETIPTMNEQLLLDITEATVKASNLEYIPGSNLTMDIIVQNKLHDESLNAEAYISWMSMYSDYESLTTKYYPETTGGDIIIKVELTDEAINNLGKAFDPSTIDISLALYKNVIDETGDEEEEKTKEVELVNSTFPVYTSLHEPIFKPEPVFNEQILADSELKKVTFTGETNVSTSGFLSAKLTVENKSSEPITTMGYIEKVNGYSVGDSMSAYDYSRDRREITVAPGETSEFILNADISSLIALGAESIGSMDICISKQSFFDTESFVLESDSPVSDIGPIDGDETVLHKDDSVILNAYTQKDNLILLLDNSTDGDYYVEFRDFQANGLELQMVAYSLKSVDTTNMGGSGFRLKVAGQSQYIQVIPLDELLLDYTTSPEQTDGDVELGFSITGKSVDQDSVMGEWTTEFEEDTSITIAKDLLK